MKLNKKLLAPAPKDRLYPQADYTLIARAKKLWAAERAAAEKKHKGEGE